MTDYPQLISKRLDEILANTSDDCLRASIARIYLRWLVELTSPQEWEKPEEAVWLRGKEDTVLHFFRVGICCALSGRNADADPYGFRWLEFGLKSEQLIYDLEKAELAEQGHQYLAAASQLVTNYFAGNTLAGKVLEAIVPDPDFYRTKDFTSEKERELAYTQILDEYIFDVRNDLNLQSAVEALGRRLFSPENKSDFSSRPHDVEVYFGEGLYSAGPVWKFWANWYHGFLEGKPIDWKLQERVALISDAIWDAGPDAVAGEIARIKVELALEDFRIIHAASRSSRHGVGGNYPPEAIEDTRDVASSVALLWDAIGDVQDEIAKPKPDRTSLEIALGLLKRGLAALIRWGSRKADLAVDTSIRWAIPVVGGTYLATHPEKVKALIEAVEEWLKFIP